MLERHRTNLTVVAINDMADLRTNAHLFRYDSAYGRFPGKVEIGEGVLQIDGLNISALNQKDPSRLPWRQLNVDIVIESTGVFTDAGPWWALRPPAISLDMWKAWDETPLSELSMLVKAG
jgi:glyceraldehyde-3-phosphate dehydrogenase/erythrose-4-phosphate dehydrogenase